MRFTAVLLLVAISLEGQTGSTNKPNSPYATGIARNQQELQQLSTLIAQNNADMLKITGDVLVSLAGAVAGAGPESAFGQSPREAVANLISSFQKVQGALETSKSALDGDAWMALSGQLKLTLDLIGETELPIRLANTLTDLLVKTAQLVSLARQNADLVAVKIQVAQAQTYLLAKATALQSSRTAARTAAQSTILPQIKAQAETQSQWLLQQYKDRPQVIPLAVKNVAAPRTASQIVSGLQAASTNKDVLNLSSIPGINPDAIAAMTRCNQIALTMIQRQASLSRILSTCPKSNTPEGDPPPCPAYEAAAVQNDSINRSSMTCNKDASGQYIPFFAAGSAGANSSMKSQPGGGMTLADGPWRLVPGSYYTDYYLNGGEPRKAANMGYGFDIRRIGPGQFEALTQIGSVTYTVALNGTDQRASGDRHIVPTSQSSESREEYDCHIEAWLSDGKLYFDDKQVRTLTFPTVAIAERYKGFSGSNQIVMNREKYSIAVSEAKTKR